MAIGATVFKLKLQISDMDRHYYGAHVLTIARHPSETDERMMLRILAFALHAEEDLQFAGGIAEVDEPDIWQRDLTGSILKWVEVGLPEEKLIRRACGRSNEMFLYCYGGSKAEIWWQANKTGLLKLPKLQVFGVADHSSAALAKMAERNMSLQATIQDGAIWLNNGELNVEVEFERWHQHTKK
jgi:uncharacterized protein YaeQ